MRFVNRNNAREVASALFLLPIAGTKEKAKQKENAVEGSFALCGGRPRLRALDVRRLLRKAGENFKTGAERSFTSPFCRHYLRVRTSPFVE